MSLASHCSFMGLAPLVGGGALRVALFLLALICASDAAAQIKPDTPLILLIEQDTIVYTPAGARLAIPAGAELEACSLDGARLVYDLGAFVIRVPQPCGERPIFIDGFEGKPFRSRLAPFPKSDLNALRPFVAPGDLP